MKKTSLSLSPMCRWVEFASSMSTFGQKAPINCSTAQCWHSIAIHKCSRDNEYSARKGCSHRAASRGAGKLEAPGGSLEGRYCSGRGQRKERGVSESTAGRFPCSSGNARAELQASASRLSFAFEQVRSARLSVEPLNSSNFDFWFQTMSVGVSRY